MTAVHLFKVLAAFLLLAAPAAAQQAGSGQAGGTTSAGAMLIEVKDENLVVMPFNLTAKQVEEMEVYDGTGERIGEVDDVLMQPGGPVVAVSVDAGGFLGIGDRDVIFGTEILRLDAGRLVTTLSRQEIEALPGWDG